ncbi:DNA mismatch repair endonuclease MutL [Leptolyngbya sp. PCC 6406]|uniref:DNA mismatch repair endonuclease MutL n=1 Tax=Leptolyngbya sp. PCC 6406 TaxID=1173264 RepID=UPI0002AC4BA0|nr:DNA mismatch repair endonuclease MutL [Leptolyngbya sp. PCC 6406]
MRVSDRQGAGPEPVDRGLIQCLPQDVVQLMAAGEVIDSPAAVVRELAENALDARATRITVAVQTQPWQIQVTDNGTGLSVVDLRQAASAHSTSKLGDCQDLWRIQTLGFRGEALHSLSRLARLTLCSRPQSGDSNGYRVTYDRDGQPTNIEPIAMAPGTQVTVTDLFYPLPARQQAAPSRQQQTRAVQKVLHTLALCHPQVTWQAIQENRPWFTLWPGDSALHLLPQVLGRVQVTDLRVQVRAVALPDGEGRLELVLGLPDRCHRPRPDGILLALNGRPVQIAEIAEGLAQVLRRSLPRDRNPVAFVHLHAPPAHIDWHRSPDKSRVYLRHLDLWGDALKEAITATLTGAIATPTEGQQRLHQLITLAEAEQGYNGSPAIATGDTGGHNPLELRAIAQVHNRYILAEHPAGLCLVEQHIAHERVLYEALCDHWQIVPLAAPVVLSGLDPDQVAQLQRIGLTVEPFGPDWWAVRTAPAPLADRLDCADALRELSQGSDLDSALVATACRTAVRNGTPLTSTAIAELLAAWQRTRHPQTCPHGRPICLTLNESSLARYFRRHWVIGKSHGLESP